MTDSLEMRVALGAAMLDEYKPDWWFEKNVSLDTLDQWSPIRCVIGQNYGGYNKGMNALDLERRNPFDNQDRFDRGFSLPPSETGMYAALTAEWKRVIRARRATATVTAYTVPQVVITGDNIEAAKEVIGQFTCLSDTYAGDLTDTGVLYAVLDALGVLPLVKA